jgi:hypothetical protein
MQPIRLVRRVGRGTGPGGEGDQPRGSDDGSRGAFASEARRRWLQGGGVLMGTLVAGSPLALLAPSRSWAVELKTLGAAEGRTLMAMGRVLYPHQKFPDAIYALLARDLDAKAAASTETAALVRKGCAGLDAACDGDFVKADAAKRLAAVKAIEGQPFFAVVRGQCVTSLYDNDMAFAALGYPGPSWDKGGYITRGFQDLTWLPEPSREASPPPELG